MEPEVGPASLTLIMEDTTGYVPSNKQPSPIFGQVPPWLLRKRRVEEPRISPASKGKQTMKKQRKEKEIATPPSHEEQE